MFDSISRNFGGIINKLRGKKIISEDDLNSTMREIRVALLEADVALPVVKEFINTVKEKALGQEVIKAVSPGQMIVKIVHDELLSLLGGQEKEGINLEVKPPVVIMMVGLQGSGKTTTAAKLALKLKKKNDKKILLASLDTQRPAAQEQLETLANRIGIDSVEIIKGQSPIDITHRAIKLSKEKLYDVVILDTAGRLHIDEALMDELKEVKKLSKPTEILLVGDSLTGQDAVHIAKEFNDKVGLTGIILTRLDGDGRGGAAISMKMVTGCPIKYIGTGEKPEDFEEFHPDRIASRILDMGDVVSFVEKAQEVVEIEEAQKLEEKLRNGTFDLDDLMKQMRNLKKLGGVGSMLSFMPGAGKLKDYVGAAGFEENIITKQEAMISSMTKKERKNPDILNSSRKMRIVSGSGTTIQQLNSLLKKFKQMRKMMDKLGKMSKRDMMAMMKELGATKDLNNFVQ
jgi:signal recognition particle subunit SRP54